MDDLVYEKYRQAGKIASSARNYGADLIKPDISFLEVAEKIEEKIKKDGAGIAFPVNISVNEIAAHYSPRHDDTLVFRKGDVVKLDVGTHVDGYIADTAITVEVGSHNFDDMIHASSDALDVAINMIKAGVVLSEVGENIEKTIDSFGFKPVSNLTGHSLEQYCLHSGVSVPNVADMFNKSVVKDGDVLAIEPFATNGNGHVVSGSNSNIFLCEKSFRSRIVRDSRSKMYFNKIKASFKTLPFAQRWAQKLFTNGNSDVIIRRLSYLGLIKQYPQLVENKGSTVTQKEHTIIVKKDGCEVTTL